MSRSRDFGAAAGSLAAPSSSYNGYAHVVDTTQSSGWNLSPYNNFNWLINGAADHWQRGTTWTADLKFIADRWFWCDTSGGGQSTDVPSGQGFKYSMSFSNSATGHYPRIDYYMHSDDAIFLAGKVVTLSFWAKNVSGTAGFYQEQQIPTTANTFSGAVNNLGGATFASPGNFSTSWQKYSTTFTVDATAATNGLLVHVFRDLSSASSTLITGLKMELGPVATPFTRNGGDRNGELLKCYTYYQRKTVNTSFARFASGQTNTTTTSYPIINMVVPLRSAPISTPEFSNLGLWDGTSVLAVTNLTVAESSPFAITCVATVASGLTINRPTDLLANNSTGAYIAFSAEVR